MLTANADIMLIVNAGQKCRGCGATDDLQWDHTPSAWQRMAEGKAIRLADVERALRSMQPGRPTQHAGRQ